MSKKRMMSRAQRIYYEQCKKQRILKELAEYARIMKELESHLYYKSQDVWLPFLYELGETTTSFLILIIINNYMRNQSMINRVIIDTRPWKWCEIFIMSSCPLKTAIKTSYREIDCFNCLGEPENGTKDCWHFRSWWRLQYRQHQKITNPISWCRYTSTIWIW